MSNISDFSDLVLSIEKTIRTGVNKITGYRKIKNDRAIDCIGFYHDLANCIENDIKYKEGELFNGKNFNFTECNQYKDLFYFQKVKTIKYNIFEIYKPESKKYEIKFEKGDLEINFS